MLNINRKKVGNPPNYFDKTFAECQDDFAVNAELNRVDSLMKFFSDKSWIGLDALHRLTSQRSYKLKITMTDFDELVLDQMKATSPIYWCQKENLGETCLRPLSSFWASAGERILGPWLSAFRAVHVYSRWY